MVLGSGRSAGPTPRRRPGGTVRLRGPRWVREVVRVADAGVDRAWEPLRGHDGLDRIMTALTNAAEFSLLWVVTGTVAEAARPRRDRRRLARLVVGLAAESAIVNQGVKRLVGRSRPVRRPRRRRTRTPLTTSFPSGHASAAVFAATLLSEDHPGLSPLWWSLAAGVAVSRIHVGAHHASDVVAGAATGWALARLYRRIWPTPGPGTSGDDTVEPTGGEDAVGAPAATGTG